jgi:hypothetical protein
MLRQCRSSLEVLQCDLIVDKGVWPAGATEAAAELVVQSEVSRSLQEQQLPRRYGLRATTILTIITGRRI